MRQPRASELGWDEIERLVDPGCARSHQVEAAQAIPRVPDPDPEIQHLAGALVCCGRDRGIGVIAEEVGYRNAQIPRDLLEMSLGIAVHQGSLVVHLSAGQTNPAQTRGRPMIGSNPYE